MGRGNLPLLCVSQPLVQAQGLAVELEGAVTLALGFVMGFKIVPCRSGSFPRVCARWHGHPAVPLHHAEGYIMA